MPKCKRLYAESPDNLTVELGPSRALTAALVLVHGGAVALGLMLPLALTVRITLVALIAVSLYRSVQRHGLRRAHNAIEALALNVDDDCALRHRGSSEWRPGRLIDRWVQRWLTILVVRCDGHRWAESVVICADALPAERFRRLRVRLRLRTEAAPVSCPDPHTADRKKDSPG